MRKYILKFLCLIGIHSYMYEYSTMNNYNVWSGDNLILFLITYRKCKHCDKIQLYQVLEYK